MSPRAVVTPENLSFDFKIELARADGPVGLNLNEGHFTRHPITGVIGVNLALMGGGAVDLSTLVDTFSDQDSINGSKRFIGAVGLSDWAYIFNSADPINGGNGGFSAQNIPNNSSWTYFMPAKNGTLALLQDVAGYVQPDLGAGGTAYTLNLANAFGHIVSTNAAASVVMIPNNSTVNFLEGTFVDLETQGVGGVSFAAAAGVNIRASGGFLRITTQYRVMRARKTGVNDWIVTGEGRIA